MYGVGVCCPASSVFSSHCTTYRIQMNDLNLVFITFVYFGLQVSEGHTVYLFSSQDNKDNRRKGVDILQSTKKTFL